MSKSEVSDLRINLTDEKILSLIRSKLRRSSSNALKYWGIRKRPEAKNLIGIYASLSGLSLEKSINEFSGKNFSIFKENLSQVIVDKIFPISKEIKKIINEKKYLDEILLTGSTKAGDIAARKLKKIHEILGF